MKQIDCEAPAPAEKCFDHFADALSRRGVELRRGETTTLQVNVGFLCNQSCRHCHQGAGPDRTEVMSRETMDAVEAFARRGGFSTIDLTGGAPELVPGIEGFLERLAPLAPRILFRANLTALAERPGLLDLLGRLRVAIIASFPSLNASQTDTQRGNGVFQASIGDAPDAQRRRVRPGEHRAGTRSGLQPRRRIPPPGAGGDGSTVPSRAGPNLGYRVQPPLHLRQHAPGALPGLARRLGESRRISSTARRRLQPLHRRRSDVPESGLRVVGRRALRLRLQPGLRPPAGRRPPARLVRRWPAPAGHGRSPRGTTATAAPRERGSPEAGRSRPRWAAR